MEERSALAARVLAVVAVTVALCARPAEVLAEEPAEVPAQVPAAEDHTVVRSDSLSVIESWLNAVQQPLSQLFIFCSSSTRSVDSTVLRGLVSWRC